MVEYSVPALEVRRVFEYVLRRTFETQLMVVLLTLLLAVIAKLFVMNIDIMPGVYIILGSFLFLNGYLYFSSKHPFIVLRVIFFIALVAIGYCMIITLQDNLVLNVLIGAAAIILLMIIAVSMAHWFAHGVIVYEIRKNELCIHLRYTGKDIILRWLCRTRTHFKWNSYKSFVYDRKANLLEMRQRTGLQIVLLPRNAKAVVGAIGRKMKD